MREGQRMHPPARLLLACSDKTQNDSTLGPAAGTFTLYTSGALSRQTETKFLSRSQSMFVLHCNEENIIRRLCIWFQREEELRKEDEKRKVAEERQRFEEERMELERKEQENREKRYRERERQIEEHR